MSYAPASLLKLRTLLAKETGLSAISLGIIGDAKHLSGYHLGRDRIFSSKGQGWSDYSVKRTVDKNGLSDAASAIDIGNFKRLRDLSIWLVNECRSNVPDTRTIREVIYSPDGLRVLRWDRERGVSSPPRQEGDDSHKTHTHVSFDRSASEHSAVFARFFTKGSSDVLAVETRTMFDRPRSWTVKAGTTLNGYDAARPNQIVVSRKWASDSSALADAFVAVRWPGSSPEPTPHGSPFLHVTNGAYAGLLIIAAHVTLEEAPTVPPPSPRVVVLSIDDTEVYRG